MQTNDQPKRGRPSDYSAEIAEAICDRLVNGESLRAVCADPAMPARATVLLRVHGIEHLADQLDVVRVALSELDTSDADGHQRGTCLRNTG